MLVQLSDIKTYLRIQSTDTSQDLLLTALLAIADRQVKGFCKRNIELSNSTYYPPPGRLGFTDLVLPERPLRCFLLTGNLTQGLATVTNLAFVGAPPGTLVQSVLVPGMAVCSQNSNTQLPAAATVLSVDSATQVTLAQNALVSATGASLFFGLNVYLDTGGFAGLGQSSPFAAQTQLFPGKDYYPDIDSPDGSSKSGILRRIGGGVTGGPLSWPWAWDQRRGSLTAPYPPVWPKYYGNCKVMYTGGYYPAAMPADLTFSVMVLVAWLRAQTPVGVAVDTDRTNAMLGALLNTDSKVSPELGTARAVLRSYREASF